MASNTAPLTRPGGAASPVLIRVNLVFSGTVDQAARRSLFNWSAECINTSGSVYGGDNSWSTSRGGGGGFSISPGQTVYLGDGSFWVQHDSAGYAPSQSITLSVSSDNSFVGSGSVSVWAEAPSLAKVPPAPLNIGLDQITATSMRYRFQSRGDGGSPILRWEYQCSDNPAFPVGAATSTGTTTRTDLQPARTYYWRARGVNAVGAGSWSETISARTLARARVPKGGAYVAAAQVSVPKGGGYAPASQVMVPKGGGYVPAV